MPNCQHAAYIRAMKMEPSTGRTVTLAGEHYPARPARIAEFATCQAGMTIENDADFVRVTANF